jgi:hypothetical protein
MTKNIEYRKENIEWAQIKSLFVSRFFILYSYFYILKPEVS